MSRLSSKLLLPVSICLIAGTHAVGQGDFEPATFQSAGFASESSQASSASPIATSYFEETQPVSQVSFTAQNLASPTKHHEEFTELVNSPTSRSYFDRSATGLTASVFGGPSGTNKPNQADAQALHNGIVFGAGIGKRFNSRWRTELEFSARRFDIEEKRIYGFLSQSFELAGDVTAYTGMANAYYDFDRGPEARVSPYIGMGIGFSKAFADETVNSHDFASGDGTAFALQAMLGLSIRISDRSRFYTELRTFGTAEHELDMYRSDRPNGPLDGQAKYTAASSELLLGLRFEF